MKDKQKAEAVERMKILGLHQRIICDFRDKHKVSISDKNGSLCYLSSTQFEDIKKWERANDKLVYHVIHSCAKSDEFYSYLFVGAQEEEWELDREELKIKYPIAFVENVKNKQNSMYGFIVVKLLGDGLVRVA